MRLSALRRARIALRAEEFPPGCRSGLVGSVIRGTRGCRTVRTPNEESAMRYMLIIHNDPELHPAPGSPEWDQLLAELRRIQQAAGGPGPHLHRRSAERPQHGHHHPGAGRGDPHRRRPLRRDQRVDVGLLHRRLRQPRQALAAVRPWSPRPSSARSRSVPWRRCSPGTASSVGPTRPGGRGPGVRLPGRPGPGPGLPHRDTRRLRPGRGGAPGRLGGRHGRAGRRPGYRTIRPDGW